MLVMSSMVSAAPVRVTWVTGWSGLVFESFMGLVNEFNSSQNEVQVDVIYGGSEMLAGQKVQAMIASGDAPDLHEMGAQYLSPFADADLLVPIEEFMKNEPGYDQSDFFEAFVDAWSYKGKFYTFPMYGSVPVWAINKDMFRENGLDPENPPKYWDEMLPALQKLARYDGNRVVRYGLNFTQTLWFYRIFLEQAGGNMLNNNDGRDALATEAIFHEQGAERGIEFWSSLQSEHNVASFVARGQINSVFLGGQTATALVSTSGSQSIIDSATFEVGFAPVPYHRELGQRLPMGAISVAVFRTNPEREQAAWKFLKWMDETPQRARWVRMVGNQTPKKSAVALLESEGFFEENPHQRLFAEQMALTIPDPIHPLFPDIYRIFVDAVERMFLGHTKDIHKGLEDASKEGSFVLQSYRP